MPVLESCIEIKAPINICFDLARSIDLHTISIPRSNEKAIAGITSGLIGLNEEVTWEATHFGIRQTLRSRITVYQYPAYFRDEMIQGPFKMIRHDHHFEEFKGTTIMRDKFEFESPLGLWGRIFNEVVLNRYLENLICKRNQAIKSYAESGKWKLILK